MGGVALISSLFPRSVGQTSANCTDCPTRRRGGARGLTRIEAGGTTPSAVPPAQLADHGLSVWPQAALFLPLPLPLPFFPFLPFPFLPFFPFFPLPFPLATSWVSPLPEPVLPAEAVGRAEPRKRTNA